MKETIFYILLNFKTPKGFESFGKFIIGNRRNMAYPLFKKMKGSSVVDDSSMLTMELRETVNELPLNVKIMTCTLEELAENCSLITKEKFKVVNLERR